VEAFVRPGPSHYLVAYPEHPDFCSHLLLLLSKILVHQHNSGTPLAVCLRSNVLVTGLRFPRALVQVVSPGFIFPVSPPLELVTSSIFLGVDPAHFQKLDRPRRPQELEVGLIMAGNSSLRPAKTNGSKRQALMAQGRCFRCRRKGHVAADCKKKSKSKLRLPDLPTEILEIICSHLIDHGRGRLVFAHYTWDFRLVCKTIQDKARDFYAKTAFSRIGLRFDNQRLHRLAMISQTPDFAKNVKYLIVADYDSIQSPEYKGAIEMLGDENEPELRRKAATDLLRRTHSEQDEKGYISQSGTDAVALTLALEKMPNLRGLRIKPTDLRRGTNPHKARLCRLRRVHNPPTLHGASRCGSSGHQTA
jgi:hypothetical protein